MFVFVFVFPSWWLVIFNVESSGTPVNVPWLNSVMSVYNYKVIFKLLLYVYVCVRARAHVYRIIRSKIPQTRAHNSFFLFFLRLSFFSLFSFFCISDLWWDKLAKQVFHYISYPLLTLAKRKKKAWE